MRQRGRAPQLAPFVLPEITLAFFREAPMIQRKNPMRRSTHSIQGFTLLEIMIVVALVAALMVIAMPGFLRARETSRMNTCQENQTKIDSGLQQYILAKNLANQEAFVAAFGTDYDTWATVLVGTDSYIRYDPKCPSGGTYSVAENDASAPVDCSYKLGNNPHDYPQSGGS